MYGGVCLHDRCVAKQRRQSWSGDSGEKTPLWWPVGGGPWTSALCISWTMKRVCENERPASTGLRVDGQFSSGWSVPGPLVFWPHTLKCPVLVWCEQSNFVHVFCVSFRSCRKCEQGFFWFSFSSCFFLPLLHKGQICWVVLWTNCPSWAEDLCSSTRVTMGFLAAFQFNALCPLGGRPCVNGHVCSCARLFPFSDDGLNSGSVRRSKLGMLFYNIALLYTSQHPWTVHFIPWSLWRC